MLFVLWILIFGFVHGAEEASQLGAGALLSPPPVDAELDAVMLEIFSKNQTGNEKLAALDDAKSLIDLKSLVSTMTKGDAKLTKYIITKLQELRGKTYAELKKIADRVARKLAAKKKEVLAKKAQDKKTTAAVSAYAAEVINSRYETRQVNRETQGLDRIMALINAMADWTTCPKDWKLFGNSCYRTLGKTYAYLAQQKCLDVGAQLVRVDNPDDTYAIKWMSTYKNSYLFVGFFRSLKTGNWAYLDGTEANPPKYFSWYGSEHNNKAYNYCRFQKSSGNRFRGAHSSWSAGPLCEHRLKAGRALVVPQTIFTDTPQRTFKKPNLIQANISIAKEWRLSFDVYQNGKVSNWGSIVHMTKGTDGSRLPAIWWHPNGNKLHMCMWTQVSTNDCYNSAALAMNQWHTIIMSQVLLRNGSYQLQYNIDGVLKSTKVQSKPQAFTNVKVYSSDPWYAAAKGFIKNLKMVNIVPQAQNVLTALGQRTLTKAKVLANSINIGKQWRLTFQIWQDALVAGWSSIVHFTKGSNGSRLPGIWFNQKSTKLHMCMWTQVSTNDCYNSPALAMKTWHTVVMSQNLLPNGKYELRYTIDGTQRATKVQTKPQAFTNVKVYSGDPWYPAARAYIKNLKMDNF